MLSLKPCPFCHSTKVGLNQDLWRHIYYITCFECFADGPKLSTRADNAQHLWNERTEDGDQNEIYMDEGPWPEGDK